MQISMRLNGRWFIPVLFCDGCGQEIERLEDGLAFYNSKLRAGEQGSVYFAHNKNNCPCLVDKKLLAENQGREYFMHTINIDVVFLEAMKKLCPELGR